MKTSEFQCKECGKILLMKKNTSTRTYELFCYKCNCYYPVKSKNIKENNNVKKNCEKNEQVDKTYKTYFNGIPKHLTIYLALGCMLVALLFYSFRKPEKESISVLKDIINLKKNYPSQKNETWLHILSVFNMSVPSVKSIIFLYSHDIKTSNCLKQQLVSVYTKGQNINLKDITYQNIDELKDYGEVLEYYKPLIKEYGIFMVNLQEVSANIARIFHSLCDDISSDIKPSVFIFTIQDNENIRDLKPLKRVNKILREAWREIKENEIWPLLSRIVKNVVEIIPENNISC